MTFKNRMRIVMLFSEDVSDVYWPSWLNKDINKLHQQMAILCLIIIVTCNIMWASSTSLLNMNLSSVNSSTPWQTHCLIS